MPPIPAENAVHPTAVIYPGAELGRGVEVGPYCVVESGVELGDGCRLAAHVHLLGRVIAAAGTVFGSGTVVGGEPQDAKYRGERTVVRIGAGCRLFEHVTVHRATGEGGETVVGGGVMLMAGSHVGHNVRLGDRAVLVNGAALGGHAQVGEGAFLSAACAVHQFARVGRCTLVGGAAMVTRDAPPFSIVTGSYPLRWRAANTVGLRRNGFAPAERDAIRRALHRVFTGAAAPRRAAQELLDAGPPYPSVGELARFVLESKRGVCAGPPRRDRPDPDPDPDPEQES